MIKKYLPTSLFGRTFLIVMVPVLLLQITVSIVFFDRHWSKMTERLAFAVTGEILAVASQIEQFPNDDMHIRRVKTFFNTHLGMNMAYIKSANLDKIDDIMQKKWFQNPFEQVERDLGEQIEKHSDYRYIIHHFADKKQVNVHIELPNGLLNVYVPEGRLFSSSSYIFILWMVGLSLLLFTIAMIFMRNQIRPIYRLGIIAERLGRGIPVGKIRPSGAREVRQAAEAFSSMQERINQYISGRTTMLAGVSHDLRTPLTRMKLQLEMMGDTPDANAIRSDIVDMERMIEGYLSFAKGDGEEDMQRINLKAVLDKMIDGAYRLSLSVIDERDKKDDVMIWAKPIALSRAFENFISNAVRYADSIRVTVSVNDDFVSIFLDDNGPGISDADLPEMLKPFVRGEQSRNQKTGGVGLGLTIANDTITAHGGKLTLKQSKNDGGLCVQVSLPI